MAPYATKILQALNEVQIQYWYHVTTDKFLPSILQHGLLAKPPQQNYDAERQPGTYWDPSFQTLHSGVYLSQILNKNFGTAISRFGGTDLIVVIQGHILRAALPDEDLITKELWKAISPFPGPFFSEIYRLKTPFVLRFIQSHEPAFERVFSRWIGKLLQSFNLTKLPFDGTWLRVFLIADITRRLSYVNRESKENQLTHEEDYREFLREFIQKMRRHFITSFSSGEVAYPHDVGFTGSPRIIALIQISRNFSIDPLNARTRAQVIYGVLPMAVQKELQREYKITPENIIKKT